MKPLPPLFLVFALCFLSPLSGLTFDLKTTFAEKGNLAPIKWGTEFALLQASHAILDVGEDYAIWLKGRKESLSGDQVTVRVLVQISETTGFAAKPILAETWVTFRYHRKAPAEMTTDDAATKFLRTKLQDQGENAWEEGRIGGPLVAKAILQLVSRVRG